MLTCCLFIGVYNRRCIPLPPTTRRL